MAEFASGDARLAQPSHQPHVRRPAPAQRPHEWESYGPTGVLRLQTQAGNAAVSTVMQRAPAGGADRDAKVEAALSASPPDAGLVKDIGNFEGLPHEKLANILVYHYSLFFGPNDRSTLRAILEAFGPEIGVLAQLKAFLLEKILKEWPELAMTVGPIKVSADSFKTVVGAEAKKNLNDNIAYLESEYKRLWGEQSADPKATLKSSQEQNQRAMAMTKVAGSLLALRRQQKRMLEQVVGFKYNEHNPVAPTSPVTFKPGKAPDATWHTQDGGEKYRELSAQWALSSMLVGENAAQYPWLFGILKDPENAEARLAELATQKDPYQARVQIQQEMTKQLNLAKDVRAKYQAKEPDWYDLVPVRNRVLVQKITGNFDVLVARGVIAERDTAEWWKKFAFEVATDAAIVVATFATAGAAPLMAGIVAGVVAAGLPGAQAYLASEKADELAKVEQATVLPGTDLAAQMQVDALRAEALAKKIELFINALTVLGGLAPAIRMELRLARLLELPALEQKVLIASSVLEKGGVYTAERTGLTLGELAARAGPESEAGKRLGREFADLLAKGSAGMSPAERAALR
ncbi:MAG: hypothetical protein QOG10_6203, partial [Kribbellaceae bacterium]|nr:hypothetical protein [Kribbellaceae bacterium]